MPSGVLGAQGAQAVRFELRAMFGILVPFAGGLQVFAGHRAGRLAHHRGEGAPALDLDAEHDKAIVRIVKGDPLDGAGK